MLLNNNVHNILRLLCPINEMSHREDGRSLDITLRVVILEFSHNEKNTRLRIVTTATINITLVILHYKPVNTSNGSNDIPSRLIIKPVKYLYKK
jgi:hypothetical protein